MIAMTIVIEKNINPTLRAELSAKLEPYKTNEARIIIMHIEMIFPKITFDIASKIEANMTPIVDITNPISKIDFIGINRMLPIFLICP